MTAIIYEDQILIPDGITDLLSFRMWSQDGKFPEIGRIDYLGGRIEIDMSPEQLFAHGRLKSEFVSTLSKLVKRSEWLVVADSTRVASEEAGLSAEPDVILLSRDSIRQRRVRLTPKAKQSGDCVEIEGAVDILIEIVSDSSVGKDLRRLPVAYYAAGVREYWIADARHTDLRFTIYRRGATAFEPTEIDEGWQKSEVLSRSFRLTRPVVEAEWVEFELESR